jgi:hypothetical protein
MNRLILTQITENYGAHDWSGEGRCPQYWKNKGGNVYVLCPELSNDDEEDIIGLIQNSDDYSEEWVMSRFNADKPSDHYDEWETPVNISKTTDGMFRATAKNEYGVKSWIMLANGNLTNYKFKPTQGII